MRMHGSSWKTRKRCFRMASSQQQPAAAALVAGPGSWQPAATSTCCCRVVQKMEHSIAPLTCVECAAHLQPSNDGTFCIPCCLSDCPRPEEVALEIAGHVKATRSLPARYVMRLLPVSLTCFASAEELKGITATMVQ